MARPIKAGVDYFSHDTVSGKTIFTLESLYGNDGYAFWFKLLEILGSQAELYYNCTNQAEWLYLVAKTRVSEEKAEQILSTLGQLEAIDARLWEEKRIIWVQNFVDRLNDVYEKRKLEPPQKPSFNSFCTENPSFRTENPTNDDVSVTESTQSKVKESKVKESKVNKIIITPYPFNADYEFVSMTNDEYKSLVAKLGEAGTRRCIEILDNYKGANGKKYKSDYRAILNWVITRYEEEKSNYSKNSTSSGKEIEIHGVTRF